MGLNNVIGNNGKMCSWYMPGDLGFFKKETLGDDVIMGRVTYDSLDPRWKPLPGRHNTVVTGNLLWDPENDDVCVVNSFWKALHKAEKSNYRDIAVIGGSNIYQQAMKRLIFDEIYITHIDGTFEGDRFFPEMNRIIYPNERIVKEIFQEEGKNTHNAKIICYTP